MKTLKKLYLVIAIMAITVMCSSAHAEIFVYDDGIQLTVSWADDSNVLYYEVILNNLTTKESADIKKSVFEPSAIMSGLTYHNIYEVTVTTDKEVVVGHKYITFALEQTSGGCVCICPELIVPKKVFFGLTSEIWWTGIAINNAGNTSQLVILKIGNIIRPVYVPSHTTEVFLLNDLIDDTTDKSYPITYETESADVGVTVLIGDSVDICIQN